MRGVDLSHHQGLVSGPKLAAAHYDFGILKASEGGRYEDKLFLSNAKSLRDAGLKIGAYHFARFDGTGPAHQVEFFFRLASAANINMGFWLDYEDRDNPNTPVGRQVFAEDFIARLLTYTSQVGWYCDQDYLKGITPSTLLKRTPLWIAATNVKNAPRVGWVGQYSIRQIDWYGKVPSVAGSCDIDTGIDPWALELWELPDGRIVQPTNYSSGLHLAPVQVDDLVRNHGWHVVNHPQPMTRIVG